MFWLLRKIVFKRSRKFVLTNKWYNVSRKNVFFYKRAFFLGSKFFVHLRGKLKSFFASFLVYCYYFLLKQAFVFLRIKRMKNFILR